MTRPDLCPNCGASTTAHTGSYCHECGEVLTPAARLPRKATSMPTVDPEDNAQNAFVQDWLTAWANRYMTPPADDAPGDRADDWHTYESAIELIQETYGGRA